MQATMGAARFYYVGVLALRFPDYAVDPAYLPSGEVAGNRQWSSWAALCYQGGAPMQRFNGLMARRVRGGLEGLVVMFDE